MDLTSRTINLRDPRFPLDSSFRGMAHMEQMLRLHSPYGLVREMSLVQVGNVLEGRLAPMDIDAYVDFVNNGAWTDGGLWSRLGPGGKGRSASHAMMSALGETVERLTPVFTQHIRANELRFASPAGLRSEGYPIPPISLLAPLHPAQFDIGMDLDAISDDSEFGWLPAHTLVQGTPTMVPAQQVCFRYRLRPQDPSFVASTSVGLAAGLNEEHATLGAINELIERDAIGLSWHCNLPMQRVMLDDIHLGPLADELVEMLRRTYPDIVVLRHLTDFDEFTVISVHRLAGPNVPAAFSAGSCASTDPAKAFIGAAIEFFQSENTAIITRQLPQWQNDDPSAQFDSENAERDTIESVNDRMAFYGVQRNYDRIRPRLEPTETCELVLDSEAGAPGAGNHPLESEYERAVGCLQRRGIDPIVFRYDSTPLFGSNEIRTVRIMIPELTLPHVPPYRFFGHPRYYTTRRALGLTEHDDTYETLCHEENPFP